MIGPRRIVPCLAAFLLFAAEPVLAQDVQSTFREGVDQLSRGNREEALRSFQEVLAADPSHEDAYELWQSTDHEIWLDMLVLEGEFEKVAKRLMDLARMGRTERENDPDAISTLLASLASGDAVERTRVVRQLAADHGEYAVPQMLYALADRGDADKRVVFMQALTKMSTDVVPALVEALEAPDPFLRRNVALTLGYIGDPRANGHLAALAVGDDDDGVRSAASQSLGRTGGTTDAAGQLLTLGDAYHRQDDSVLPPHRTSRVIWNWEGERLESLEVPRFLYHEEMAKKAYGRCLEVAPGAVAAHAGLARATVSEHGSLAEWAAAGEDTGDWEARLQADMLAVHLAGSGALDRALSDSLDQGDQTAAVGLARAMASASGRATPALERAASTGGGPVRAEAAVALARIAARAGTSVGTAVVSALADSAGREVVRIAAVIDGDDGRRTALSSALRAQGMAVNAWASGGRGLAGLRAVPGVDVIFVSDPLPDLTVNQVLDELAQSPRLSGSPVFVVAADPETASELHGDRTAGVIGSAADMSAIEGALSDRMNRDREEALDLAARSASALADLAGGGSDVSAAADALVGTLGRTDDVALPAMRALGRAGAARHVGALASLAADASRSDEARIAAADALSGIFARHSVAEPTVVEALSGVLGDGDTAFEIRAAAASALGRLDLDPGTRADLVRGTGAPAPAE